MAKADTVYSMFGMETPQQVAARRLKEQTTLLSQYQRDPFQSAGAAIGMGLMRLFGPEDQQMARSQRGMEIIQQARAEQRQAAEAKQAQAESLGGAMEAGLPAQLAAEERLAMDQQKYYELYNTIADRLDAAGFPMEAENARTKASQQLLGSLSIRKQLADIGYTEAKTAAEGKGKWANLAPYILPDGTEVTGGTFNGQLAVQGADGQPRPMPPGSTKRASVPTQPTTTVPTVAQAGIAMPWIKQDPMASELSSDEQGALAGWMAGKAQELLDQKQVADPNAAYQMALELAKQQGLLRSEAPSSLLGVDVPFTGGPVFTLKPEQVPQGAPNSTPEPTAQADPDGSVRRYVGDRVALFDEKTKKFIRYVD